MKPGLDIIFVNWNAGDQLRTSLQSIADADKDNFALARVMVVDNASTDDSLQGLETMPLPLQLIRNETNRGFATACNQGAAGSDAAYLLFLNCDTRLFANSLTDVIAFMQDPKQATIGICGIRLVDETGQPVTTAARFPTLRVMLGKMTGLSRLLPGFFPSHLMRAAEMPTSCEVDQVIGAFFLMRRTVYELCEGFDERFFLYFEEVDLALRAKERGYRSYYFADVTAFHAGGGLTGQVKAQRLFYSLRSRIVYARKHYARSSLMLLLCCTLTIEPFIRLLRAIFRLSPQQVMETLSGYRMFLQFLLRRQDPQ